ncbi:sodium:pantothenate symporter [Lysinibacillus alkalisoli]|uniref:Sodium:pantothenate symporter n=1 Tax=Lysinibacillus alkalisoli TaxID=1911548 RepID=A0A917G123_9BACI|nr:YhdT family protein [Lysinibacillus alkalisoli]GGG16709.1 sodium:pantothenate symporter [Lysinibacillus alkalisoli]
MNDKRFKIANREAWIGVLLVMINFAIWFGFAYGLGSGDPTEYTYVLGFPAWFFYSCIAGTIFMIVLLYVVIKVFFKDVPFDEEEPKS